LTLGPRAGRLCRIRTSRSGGGKIIGARPQRCQAFTRPCYHLPGRAQRSTARSATPRIPITIPRGTSMTKTTTMLWLAAGLILTFAAPSGAQTPPPPTQTPAQTPPPAQPPAKTKSSDSNSAFPTKNLFIDINGGVQAASHSLSTTATPTIYDETANISSTQKTGSGGLFDFGIGYRV